MNLRGLLIPSNMEERTGEVKDIQELNYSGIGKESADLGPAGF